MHIDQDRCRRDGLCALACPVGLVRVLEKGGLPVFASGRQGDCIRCGHCLAVCPTEAISLSWLAKPGGLLEGPREEARTPGEAALAGLMRSRRSMRRFKAESLGPADLDPLFDAVRFAPSGHNAQTVDWLVVGRPADVREVGGLVRDWAAARGESGAEEADALHLAAVARAWDRGRDFIVRGAPCLVLAHASRQGITPVEDAVIATAWLELAAHAAGLGACWAGLVAMAARDWPPLRERLGLTEDRQVWGALMLGRPALRYRAAPDRPAPRVRWM